MKITIEPSHPNRANSSPTTTIDSRHDEDTTGDAMDVLAAALTAYGHHPQAITDWAEEWVENHTSVKGGVDE